MTPLMTGLSYPVHATKMMAQTNAIIKLNTGPAATTEILAPTDLLWKESSALLSPSSPSIIQAPPKGSNLMEYLVSPFVKPTSVGPNPMQNSLTRIPARFANRKCPSSWNRIMMLKINIAKMIFKVSTCSLYTHILPVLYSVFFPNLDFP